ncbi:MAG: hypothetical protein LH606_14100 [Cytophagaceae bacterium]|nr:hypothetical protein [Cytophagaceae bacterium]
MKKTTWFLPLLLLAACSSDSGQSNGKGEANAEINAPNTCSLVLLDKSVSINANDPYIRQKYQQALATLISENIKRKGDRLDVYFIHDNTAKAKALERVCQSEKEDVSSANQTDAEAAETSFAVSLQKEQAKFQREATAQLAAPNPSSSNRYTDILASLPVANRLAERGFRVKTYYFSDMIESMRGTNRRDFHTAPPASSAQAESWARQDAERLKPTLPKLTEVEFYTILPFQPTASSKTNNPNITLYWETLLRELGVSKRLEEL